MHTHTHTTISNNNKRSGCEFEKEIEGYESSKSGERGLHEWCK